MNTALRDRDRVERGEPHPLPVTVSYLNEAVKKLRAVQADDADGPTANITLWRGLRNLQVTDKFMTDGGTEACATCDSDPVALSFVHQISVPGVGSWRR